MASSKMAKNDTAASDDAERAEWLAEQRVALRRQGPGEHMANKERKPRLTLYEAVQGMTVPFPWWRADPLFEDGGPVAELLTGLSRSRRDEDGALSLSEALDLIGFFVGWYSAEGSDSDLYRQWLIETRDKFDKIYKKTVELIADVRTGDNLHHNFLLEPENCSPSIEATLATLEGFAEGVDARRKRLVEKRGPKTKPREFAEAIIQTIEMYTGAKVKRSNKQGAPAFVVQKIVEIMDPAIGSSTIDEALKARSKALGEI
jgi:hypothetical protein